jgi:pilus assembly protein CpaE
MQALDSIENLDEIALMGYVAKHASGLHVLHTLDTECILPGEVDLKRLERLIDVINRIYEHMVVDLPHMIDPVFNLILEQADHLVIVMQQDIYSVRDARRMIRIITGELGMPMERIIPVLNRYVHNNAFGLADVEHTLALQPIFVVPNDFNNLSTASNLGIAIADHAPRSPATRAIQKLAANLSGKNNPAKPGAFRLFLSRLIMGDKR